ncbi:MAG: hypothetical protein EP349_00085 [Alphaproteobacteria bacterium]|nr:MAG: hypothetical protein EP349_00085 [Alphaproteobacteria bacterium]
MLKKSLKIIGIFFILSLVYAAYDGYRFYQENKVTLRYNFEKGQSFDVKKHQEYYTEITEGEGKGWKELTVSDYRVGFTVNDIADNGKATVTAKISHYQIEKSSPDGQTEIIGSDREDMVSALLNNAILYPFVLEITPTGEITNILNFDDIQENFIGEAPEEAVATPEAVEMLEILLTSYVGTKDTAKDVLFEGYFPVWPAETVTAGKEWVQTRTTGASPATVNIKTTYQHPGNAHKGKITISYAETMENPHSGIPGLDVAFSNQESKGFITYKKNDPYPPRQLYDSQYEMSQYMAVGDEKKLLAKVRVETRKMLISGNELKYEDLENMPDLHKKEMDDLQKSLAAQKSVDDAISETEEYLRSLPDPATRLQNAQQILQNAEKMGQQLQEEREYQERIRALGNAWEDVKPDAE